MITPANSECISDAILPFQSRKAGVIYLLYFLTAIAGQFLMKGLVVSGDAFATAHNILAHEARFRLGLGTGLIATALYVALTALLYDLFRPVSRSLALVAASFSLLGCAVQAAGSAYQFAPLVILDGSGYVQVFNAEQLRALALLFLKLHTQSSHIELVFFALFDVMIGYLIYKSNFLPRALGILMALAGIGWLSFLAPSFASQLSPYVQILGFVAEAMLMLRLLVTGVSARP